ncbi:MAG: hypothetical protein WBG57_06175 [Ornithinimicrobium sp.]
MSSTVERPPEPDLGMPPGTDEAGVDDALSELAGPVSESGHPVEAKVAAATRAHQRLQAILSADRD